MRRKPYTEIGINRVPCRRCGGSSSQQWQICSLDNKWAGICDKCDIELNRIVLEFMRFTPNMVECLIKDYENRKEIADVKAIATSAI